MQPLYSCCFFIFSFSYKSIDPTFVAQTHFNCLLNLLLLHFGKKYRTIKATLLFKKSYGVSLVRLHSQKILSAWLILRSPVVSFIKLISSRFLSRKTTHGSRVKDELATCSENLQKIAFLIIEIDSPPRKTHRLAIILSKNIKTTFFCRN